MGLLDRLLGLLANAEDEQFTGNPRSLNQFSPQNADIRNFQMQPQGMPEDAGMMSSQQGYVPQNADVANFRPMASRFQNPAAAMQRGRMPMNMESIPGNFGRGRTGYYQGSNPYLDDTQQDSRFQLRVR